MAVTVLPTWYSGCMYRSRLEARCAVFFDQLEEPFEYEPNGLKIDEVCYLPDFYLPRLESYFEVKGAWDASMDKPFHLANALAPDSGVYALIGGFPSYRQLVGEGWWDAGEQRGITALSPAYSWDAWFPPTYPLVLEACEAARSAKFHPARRRPTTLPDVDSDQRPAV